MVKIEEVNDDWEDDNSSISGDSVESDDSLQLIPFDPSAETLGDRFYALKDIVPPSTRANIAEAAARTAGWVKWGGLKVGNAAWIVTTSALLVGLPLMLSIEGEAGVVQQEKDYMGQGGAAYGTVPPAGGAATGGLVPPGF